VIGYLASDYEILSGGKLAAPLPTFNLLEGRKVAAGQTIEYKGCDENCVRFRQWIKEGDNQKKLEAWLEKEAGRIAIADFLTGDDAELRRRAAAELITGTQ
jgi:hypothetical protein